MMESVIAEIKTRGFIHVDEDTWTRRIASGYPRAGVGGIVDPAMTEEERSVIVKLLGDAVTMMQRGSFRVTEVVDPVDEHGRPVSVPGSVLIHLEVC